MNRFDLENKSDEEVKQLADEGNKTAMAEYGLRLYNQDRYEEAFSYLYPLKDLNNSFVLGIIIEIVDEKGEALMSDKEFFKLCLTRHNMGISYYTLILGECYKTGRGCRKSLKKYIECLTLCSNDGSASATRELAHCYETGFGVRKSLKKAFKIYDGFLDDHCRMDYWCAFQVAIYRLNRYGGVKKDMGDIKYHLRYAARAFSEAKQLYIELFHKEP